MTLVIRGESPAIASRVGSSLATLLLFAMLCAAQMVNRAAAADSDYHVGPGDLVRISVFGSPELALDARVSESGNITYPLIGQVPVAGLSAGQIEQALAQRLVSGQFLRSPQVSALVIEYQSQKISVLGQVTKPGQYPLTASTHVMDLLAQAGGPVQPVAADEATLVRKDGTKVPVDLTRLFQGDPSQNFTVAGGDTIFVPKAAQFYIYGEVQKPGMYRIEKDMTISRAISSGGGLTPRGSERHTVVKRRDANGKEKQMSVKSSDPVQPDDVILVNESWF
jgi:polysaccharide export outer membrane protein